MPKTWRLRAWHIDFPVQLDKELNRVNLPSISSKRSALADEFIRQVLERMAQNDQGRPVSGLMLRRVSSVVTCASPLLPPFLP